jgi:hypothetical protein
VAVATFELIRPLTLLNLQLLRTLEHPKGSLFETGYSDKLSKYKFLRTLTDLIARPVMPNDEKTDYLTTQAVADFLSIHNKTSIDGIIFPSVQSPSKGRNIVLFHKASLVEKREFPEGTNIFCQSNSLSDDQTVPDFHVFEELPEPSRAEKVSPIHYWNDVFHFHPHLAWKQAETREATLRVNVDKISIHQIKDVGFNVQEFDVKRTQTTKHGRSEPL